MENSVFKTEAGRDKVRAYYNRVLSQFPFGQQYVKTTFGQTFIITAGRESNPPAIPSAAGWLSNSQQFIQIGVPD